MIDINNLSFGYAKGNKFFNNLSLSLKQGGICGLLGKNGAGKTSLLKIIAGLVFPNAGHCQVMQQTPRQRKPSFLSEVYFLAEDLFVPALTADAYAKFYAPFYPRFNIELFHHYLSEFELPRDKLLTALSHGQQKKCLLAFGLATDCRLLILDEPTNGLDIPSKTQFRKLLATTISEEKLFIISTHQVHDVENLIDSIVVLEAGNIIFQQSLVEISKRLAFIQQPTEPDLSSCFYYKKDLGGYTVVVANQQDQDTHIDFEVLFNAILTNPIKMQQLFSRG